MRKHFLICILVCLVCSEMYGHTAGEDTLKINTWINKISSENNLIFYYNDEWFANRTLPDSLINEPSVDHLRSILEEFGFRLIAFDPNFLIIVIDNTGKNQINGTNGYDLSGENQVYTFDLSKTYTITGTIDDGKTSESLIGATIFIHELATGTITNEFGQYSIPLPSGSYNLTISALGFDKEAIHVNLLFDTTLNFELFDLTTHLKEIIVYEEAEDHNVSNISMGTNRLNISTIKSIPPLMGEVDIIRSITLLPGVTTVGEGATGYNVRGGGVDQNLVLLEEAPIFNTSHFFGFFSSFNSKSVKDVTLSKGGIPAQYGGRISSVLDIKIKSGKRNKISGDGGIGLLSANLMFDGPINKDKTTFLISGRATYSDYYLKFVPDTYVQNSSANFYDLIGKITHKINDNNFISLTGYHAHDKFGFPGDTAYYWNSSAATLKWSKTINSRLNMITSLVYSQYDYEVEGRQPENAFIWSAGIRQVTFKGDFNYNLNFKNKIDAGYGFNHYNVRLGDLNPNHEISNINSFIIPSEKGLEPYAYYNHEFKWNRNLTLMGGLRLSGFLALGPREVNTYEPDQPKNLGSLTGTEEYQNGEIIKSYFGLEPRVSIRYGVGNNSSIKASYNRMRQYIHLISNTSAVSPVDIWKLSDYYIPPQIGDQATLGYFRNFFSNTFETSIETYYKVVKNSIDYKDGADLVLNDHIETDLVFGQLTAYGVELFIQKNKGRLTGWLGYTLSNATMMTNKKTGEESINFGEPYPVNFDKLHDLSIVGNYQITRRYSFGFSFLYNSGRPITYPVGAYGFSNVLVANFESRNQERVPDYHRLDVSVTIEGNHKRDKKWHGSWIFSIYNLYGRKNPYSIFFKAQGWRLPQAYKLAIIGIPVPSVTYNFKF